MADAGNSTSQSNSELEILKSEVWSLKSLLGFRTRDRKENGKWTNATNCRSRVGLSTSFCIQFLKSLDRFLISWIHNNAKSIDFNLLFTYSLLFLIAQKNIVRFSHENIGIFKEFGSIVNMLRLRSEFFYIYFWNIPFEIHNSKVWDV